jgi:hypothetical protein
VKQLVRYLVLFVALLPLACTICHPQVEPTPPPMPVAPPPPSDAGSPPVVMDAARLDACDRACRNLRARHCPDGDPTPAGTTCEAFCRAEKARPESRLTARYLACLAAITTCASEDGCAR